jgi:hypothetical protein
MDIVSYGNFVLRTALSYEHSELRTFRYFLLYIFTICCIFCVSIMLFRNVTFGINIVPNVEVGYCLGSEENWVSVGGGE